MGRLNRRAFLIAAATAPLAAGAVDCPARASGSSNAPLPRCGHGADAAPDIEPMTAVTVSPRSGYFSDPYPITRHGNGSTAAPAFSGSPKSIITCSGRFGPGSYVSEPITVTLADSLVADAAQHGATFQAGAEAPNVWSENNNIVRDSSNTWQLATTLRVSNPSHPEKNYWTVIVHASPTAGATDDVPTSWVADTLLVGSYEAPDAANYCGKYVEDGGHLYLTYSKRLNPEPNATNGIVAQLMVSATALADEDPVVLIQPESAAGGVKSELFFGLTQPPNFKITETGNVVRIGDIYVMSYSTGAFDLDTYKTGLAFNDTFLPASGSIYRKIFAVDEDGVWGSPGRNEVRYLLQAQEDRWPNYVAADVLAPGVPSIRRVGDNWYLFFAGFRPDDAPIGSGTYDPAHRRPFFLRLKVAIPDGATVAGATDAELATWITAA